MKLLTLVLSFGLSFSFAAQGQAQSVKKATAAATSAHSLASCRALVLEKSEFDHKDNSLQGVNEIYVLMSPLQPTPRVTLNMDDIKKAVEQKCRANGLRIVDHGWKAPVLIVGLTGLSGPKDGQIAYILRLDVMGIGILAKDMKTRTSVPLYGFERLECAGQLNASQAEMQADVLECVDHFISEWYVENRPASKTK